jgi:hypothetical protein
MAVFLCSNVFSLNRFGDHKVEGIELNVVNMANVPIVISTKSDSISLFRDDDEATNRVVIEANRTCNIELAFRNVAIEENYEVDVSKSEIPTLKLNIRQNPSPSIKKDVSKYSNSGQQLVWKLYSSRKGGGAQYYLVLANDNFGLSFSRPIDSKIQ